jgi:hypothetical protein
MYISLPVLALGLGAIALLCAWSARRLKAQIIREKLISFSFVVSVITDGALITNGAERINWMAKRLGNIRGGMPNSFSDLVRAACVLQGVRDVINREKAKVQGAYPTTLLDIGGENLRFLGLETAGAGQPRADELAKIAINVCGKFPDIIPVDEFSGIIMNDDIFNKDGDTILTSEDFQSAQLLVERTLVDLYRDRVAIKLFSLD